MNGQTWNHATFRGRAAGSVRLRRGVPKVEIDAQTSMVAVYQSTGFHAEQCH
jgi:predicted GNAT family N-acyltransferase